MSVTDEPTPSLFEEIQKSPVTRRNVLAGGLAAGAVAFLGPFASPTAAAGRGKPAGAPAGGKGAGEGGRPAHAGPKPHRSPSALGFDAVGFSTADAVVVPAGYVAQVLVPWGDPVLPGGPAFKPDGTNTAAEQGQQFGMGHDGMEYFPLSDTRGLLVVNHEAVDTVIMYPSPPDWTVPENVLRHQNAHGVAVTEIEWQVDRWVVVTSSFARRITGNTPMELTGPAAGHALLKTRLDPTGRTVLGTLNNCGAGRTPWGTYLTCEENFDGYFGTELPFTPNDLQKRYGVTNNPWHAPYHKADPRFDLVGNANEENRFGWIVEIDPTDAAATPKKRTALGRMKHENASFAEATNGRAVVYTGDDQRFEFLYKYVSARPWHAMRNQGVSPLDEGTLYVAKFNDDGTGTWLPLVPSSVPGYPTLADILIDARGAARAAGATPMDRPEWVATHPTLAGVAYATFTNNTARTTTDAANPRVKNAHGHIIRWENAGGDHGAETFTWSIFALAGRGLGTGDGSTIAPADMFGSPDGLAFDADGRLWIQTDGGQPRDAGETAPALVNNQMLAADPQTGDIRRFLVGPKGCEITGWTETPDRRTLFVNIQHPGENAKSHEAPTEESSWPTLDRKTRPRSATVAVRRTDGGIIGA